MGRLGQLELILMKIVLLMFALPAIAFSRHFLKGVGRPGRHGYRPTIFSS